MKGQYELKLVDGDFTPDNARDVLLALIKSKIRYHACEAFSLEERFGQDVSHSKKRTNELKEAAEELREIIKFAEESGMELKVNSTIEIELVPAEKEVLA